MIHIIEGDLRQGIVRVRPLVSCDQTKTIAVRARRRADQPGYVLAGIGPRSTRSIRSSWKTQYAQPAMVKA